MKGRALAAAYLAVGFGFVSYVAIVVEPRMGFESFADFFDPAKVSAGYRSWVWQVSNYLYLSFPVALWILAIPSDDSYHVWSGVVAGLLLFVVGAIDRIGIDLPAMVADEETLRASYVSLLPIRMAVLKSFVFALGLFAWRTTRTGWGAEALDKTWRALGYLALVVGALFVFAPVPAPLVIVIWAAALAIREQRA